jgi:hypothetical protein
MGLHFLTLSIGQRARRSREEPPAFCRQGFWSFNMS